MTILNNLLFLGYDSDDECAEHDRHLVAHTRRRNKGKKYVAVASDDPVDYAYFKAVSDRYHGHSEERRTQQQSPKMSKSDPNLNRECYPGGAVAVGATPYTDNVSKEQNVSRLSERSCRQHNSFLESPSMSQTRSVSSGDIAGSERDAQQYRRGYSDQSRSSEDVGKVNTYIRQVADGGNIPFTVGCDVVGGRAVVGQGTWYKHFLVDGIEGCLSLHALWLSLGSMLTTAVSFFRLLFAHYLGVVSEWW